MIAIETEMPKNCVKCLLLYDGKVTDRCRKNMKDVTDLPTRPDWCPLKEIVTCKECKHRNGLYTCEKLLVVMEDDCFCCFGERRE